MPNKDPDVVVTHGHTMANAANLAPRVLARLMERYEGTSIGRQELAAEVLDDVAGALWSREMIDGDRIVLPLDAAKVPGFKRVVVAVDPMITDIAIKEAAAQEGASDASKARKKGGAETGIVVAALGTNGHAYVLADESLSASPLVWANRAVGAFDTWHADRIIGETNNGGAMIETTLRSLSRNIPYRSVNASRGKITRAEPIAALYEQHKVHHIGAFDILEDQMVTYIGDPNEKSPDRMDALVWALTELMLGNRTFEIPSPVGVTTDSNKWSGANND